jgi:hypothetical protein
MTLTKVTLQRSGRDSAHFSANSTRRCSMSTHPLRLFSDNRPRLVEARTRAINELDQWAADEPESVDTASENESPARTLRVDESRAVPLRPL